MRCVRTQIRDPFAGFNLANAAHAGTPPLLTWPIERAPHKKIIGSGFRNGGGFNGQDMDRELAPWPANKGDMAVGSSQNLVYVPFIYIGFRVRGVNSTDAE